MMRKLLVLIYLFALSTIAHTQNIAPPVPVDTNAGNGHIMKTELKIDVKDDVDKIIVKHTSAHPKLTTKTYVLKEAEPTTIRAILQTAVTGTKDRDQINDIRIESISYKGQEFTGILVVTAPEDRFEEGGNGGVPIPTLVEMLDHPLMIDLDKARNFQIYEAKHRPANKLKELVESYILDSRPPVAFVAAAPEDIEAAGGVDAYQDRKQKNVDGETKYGEDFVFTDLELNQLYISSAPYNIIKVRKFLEHHDQPYSNLHVTMKIYEVANKNELGIGNDFNSWKNNNATSLLNYTQSNRGITLKAELDAKYIDFLARKGKAKVYSSLDMLLRPNRTSTYNQRKIKVVTLPKSEEIPGANVNETANGQVPAKVETSKTGDPATAQYYYGTSLEIMPLKQGDYTKLEIDLNNISLVGFNDDGSAKTAVSTLKTEVVSNLKGTKYVAGYLSRKEVVKSVTKVPLLGSIPYLGYLFSSEEDHTKTHQLVVVISCVEQEYDDESPVAGKNDINMINETVEGSEVDPTPRFDQR